METIKLRAWNEKNQAFTYATLKDIWINGWYCCEGLESPRPPKDEQGTFTQREALEKTVAFYPNAKWELFTGKIDKNNIDIYAGDAVKIKRSKWPAYQHTQAYAIADYSAYFYGWKLSEFIVPEHPNGRIISNLYDYPSNEIEVIDNIYENPKLLNQS